MPYRVDLRNVGDDALDRLVELGAIDAECSHDGGIAALMPDGVGPEQVASAALAASWSLLPWGATPDQSGSSARGRFALDAFELFRLTQRPSPTPSDWLMPRHSARDCTRQRRSVSKRSRKQSRVLPHWPSWH